MDMLQFSGYICSCCLGEKLEDYLTTEDSGTVTACADNFW